MMIWQESDAQIMLLHYHYGEEIKKYFLVLVFSCTCLLITRAIGAHISVQQWCDPPCLTLYLSALYPLGQLPGPLLTLHTPH